jgi:23S rRNA (cytosine1962-C5)-methyltransferase
MPDRSFNVILKQGREKSVLRRHPWLFSGAIDAARTDLDAVQPGAIVAVRDHEGGFLARGYYNPRSQIRVRLLTWDQDEALGPAWWRVRLARAISRREALAGSENITAYRLVHAESDGLPGLIVDRYGDYLVLQALTLGIEVVKETIVEALADLLDPAGVYERSDADVRHKEGLDDAVGVLWGEAPPASLIITEHGVRHPVDVLGGHKTGFYLDQRESRRWLLTDPAVGGCEVLNAFSYTGGFGACALLNGASHVVNVDSSQAALDLAAQTMALNDLDEAGTECVSADVFQQLRAYRDEERTFDLIILDPPKFASSPRQVKRAARGYKDINLLAFRLLRPGGTLLTFSCSGAVSPDLFQKIVFGASVDAGRDAQIAGWLNQPADHPVLLSFPEGRYLKGLICRVV